MRIKKITWDEFQVFACRQWVPVELVGSARPDWMKNMSPELTPHVFASGSNLGTYSSVEKKEIIGGIDAYRDATGHPEKCIFNVDHYTIIRDPRTDDCLLVKGPYKRIGHHVDEIAARLEGAEIITCSVAQSEKKPKDI